MVRDMLILKTFFFTRLPGRGAQLHFLYHSETVRYPQMVPSDSLVPVAPCLVLHQLPLQKAHLEIEILLFLKLLFHLDTWFDVACDLAL